VPIIVPHPDYQLQVNTADPHIHKDTRICKL